MACALELQRAPLGPIRLRIGVHTGDVQLRDEGNDIGPTVIRTARLRDLAHGWPDRVVWHDKRFGARQAPGRCVVDRSRHPPAARSAATRARGATLSHRLVQRVPTPAHAQSRFYSESSSTAHHVCWTPSRNGRTAPDHHRQPACHSDRRWRCRQDPARRGGRGPTGRRVRRRGVVCRPGADHQSARGAGDRRTHAGPSRSAGPLDDRHTAQVRRRPKDIAAARQLRAPARRVRRADRRSARCLPAIDDSRDQP